MKEIWLKAEISTLKSEKENLTRTLEESAERIREQDTKWQKLKEWLKNQITDLRCIEIKTKTQSLRVNDAVNCFREVLSQMQELGVEDD